MSASTSTYSTPITVAHGDGIGPEIMTAALAILKAGGAKLDIETIEIGEKVYQKGNSTGIDQSAWDSLERTNVFLKAPITTPQGGGVKSLNVTVRKTLGLYANIRPCVSYYPFVATKHPKMDMVIVRENEEDLYAGIEHRQTAEVTQCLKLVSRTGSEKIIRYAFEYAMQNGRKKVTCITKDNIMKITDGLFHRVFDDVSKEYPRIASEHMIVDIGAARIADTPEWFDVIVSLNLYGDIISDIAAQVAGSVGLAGSANIGERCAMFEAIHGSAPNIAGQNIANPSGLLKAAIMMLVHIGQGDIAAQIENAWLYTIESGSHTRDIYKSGSSKECLGTKEFADRLIQNLGQEPSQLPHAHYPAQGKPIQIHVRELPVPKKVVVGVDVFLDSTRTDVNAVGEAIYKLAGNKMKLLLLASRGLKIWPDANKETKVSDLWRCRFMANDEAEGISHQDIIELLSRIAEAKFDFIKFETLCTFDGVRSYSLAQGQ